MNQLILGDNLEILKNLGSNSVDLIYLDPPFFSNRNYTVIWGDAGEIRSFQDRWAGGMDHYLAWLKDRVIEMYRVLKPTGSLFLHCDWHADAYIRVYILDKVFGNDNFRNHIVWHYSNAGLKARSKKFHQVTDTIYFYSKTDQYTYNHIFKNRKDRQNKQAKRKFNSITKKADMVRDEHGKIVYMDRPTVLENSLWTTGSMSNSPERLGYPTQKPEALLERIILCASNEGDLVLDPFVGGGTTVAVADRLKRQWIGIDQSMQAITVSKQRLQKQQGTSKNSAV